MATDPTAPHALDATVDASVDASVEAGTATSAPAAEDTRLTQLTGLTFEPHHLNRAIDAATEALLGMQIDEQYWVGELEADVSLNAEYIMFLHFMGYDEPDTVEALIDYIRMRQLDDGSWGIFEGAEGNLSITCEAYFAAKLAGYRPETDEWVGRAKAWILANGGLEACRALTKIYLSYFGQTRPNEIPTMPISFMLLPVGQPFNIYEVACWARSYTVPLLVLNHFRPVREVPDGADLEELRLQKGAYQIKPNATEAITKFWTDFKRSKNRVNLAKDKAKEVFSWGTFFRQADNVLKLIDKTGLHIPELQRKGLKKAEQWILDHQDAPGDWGGIFPSMANSLMALYTLGYSKDHPVMVKGKEAFDRLRVYDTGWLTGKPNGQIRHQPCASPVWDSAWAVLAIQATLDAQGRGLHDVDEDRNDGGRGGNGKLDAKRIPTARDFDGTAALKLDRVPEAEPELARAEPERARLAKAAQRWIAPRQIERKGDWSMKNPTVPPGGWCFQFANDWYPDLDDTAVVLMSLFEVPEWLDETWRERVRKGFRWLVGLQNGDGGWGAFERAVPGNMLESVPFNDCDNLGDPSTPDLTGRVIEALGRIGYTASSAGVSPVPPAIQNDKANAASKRDRLQGKDDARSVSAARNGGTGDTPVLRAIDRAVDYINRTQEADGSWFGRWGVNHVYGTWSVIAGLQSVGIAMDEPHVTRSLDWLLRVQNSDGGWGEACDSYVEPEYRGLGRSTASQTAWALLALTHGGRADSEAARRGAAYLIREQADDGLWYEQWYTGTGFPGHFYLKYHYYPKYFTLLALARYRRAINGEPIRNPLPPDYQASLRP